MTLNMIVGLIANFITFLFILNPLRILATHSKSKIAHAPYVSMFANGFAWTTYGILIHNPFLSVVNCFGLEMSVYYMYRMHPLFTSRERVGRYCGIFMGLYGVLLFSHFYLDTPSIPTFGFISSFISVVLFASPLSTLYEVIQQKSTESISFPMSFSMFFLALSWTLYGSLEMNVNVFLPNFLGLLLSITQLILFIIYPHKKPHETIIV